ncbi:hypothetical protein Tco_1038126 [Tanacetum coccineum]
MGVLQIESSGGNLGGHSSSDKSLSGNEGEMTLQSVYDLCLSLCAQVSDQAKEIQHLKAHIKKLKKQAKPVINIPPHQSMDAKLEPSVQRDPLFDEIPEDILDHMETENCSGCGRGQELIVEAEKKFKQLESDEETARKIQEEWEILAEKLQEKNESNFTIEERANFIHETIAAQQEKSAQQDQ